MRTIAALISLVIFSAAWAGGPPIPELRSPVEDEAHLFTSSQADQLRAEAWQLFRQAGVQFEVLTVPSLQGEPIESYSIHVVEKWKLGSKREDNGLLLLIARDDHRMRIEVGRGLEGAVTDLESSRIIRDTLTPSFKQGRYFEGVQEAFERVRELTAGPAGQTPLAQEQAPTAGKDITVPPYLLLFALIALLVVLVLDWALRSWPMRRAAVYAFLSAPLSILGFMHPALGLPLLLLILFPVFAFVMGLIGILTLLEAIFYSQFFGGRGGGWGGGGGSWGGGGGSFSGGGSSGSW